MLEELTVILPTRNEAANIPVFLRSLPPELSLIVVDASEDETAVQINTLRPTNTRIIHNIGNVTVARQIGAEAASTEWLLFSDADVSFDPHYFEQVSLHLTHDAVYGPKKSLGAFSIYYSWFSRSQQLAHALGIAAASGSNLLIRRAIFEKVGGFDLTLSVNEDSEIAWRIKRLGYDVAFAKDLIVYEHDHRRLLHGRLRKTIHSLLRCALIFSGLMPKRLRQRDWGYWAESR